MRGTEQCNVVAGFSPRSGVRNRNIRHTRTRAKARDYIFVSFLCFLCSVSPVPAQNLPLSIHVHTETGAAIPGVTVEVEHDGKSTRMLTDRDGHVGVSNINKGDYKISVSAEGF